MNASKQQAPKVRWWPALLLVGLAIVAILLLRGGEADNRQNQFLLTAVIGALTGLLLFLWLLFFSRLRWSVRGALALGIVALCALAFLVVRIDGFSGNMVPQWSWRWERVSLAEEKSSSGKAPWSPAVGQEPPARPDIGGHTQFMGATRDGRLDGAEVSLSDLANEPVELWRVPVGAGWSGFAIDSGIAVTLWQEGELEQVIALDAWTGEVRWQQSYPARHDDPLGGVGPRSVPTIVGERVVTFGGTGILTAFNLFTGERVWSVDVVQHRSSSIPDYGVSSSPLVVDDQVIVLAGGAGSGSLAAYSLQSGEFLWSGGGDPAAYSSPMLAQLDGEEQVVVLNDRNVAGHAIDDGKVRWATPWPRATEKCAQPVYLPGGRLFVSSGYGIGGKLYQIADGKATLLWENLNLKAKFSTPIYHEGHLYGLDDGILVSLDIESGERNWKKGRYGHGQMMLVGDTLLIQAEDGSVAWVAARPDRFEEISSFQALQGKTWNHPALAGELLVVRNDVEAAAYRVPIVEKG